ncbi:MAG: hypothetical protein OEV72_03890 [Thermoleophilia bacterium]|nr:hypothetical protein [Thermoleophilia bacterium]
MSMRTLVVIGLATSVAAVSVAVALAGQKDRYGPWESAAPVAGEVNSAAMEGCPIVSPNGLSLYFASNRAGGVAGNAANDIWISRRADAGSPWGRPVNIGEPVNSAYSDYCPSPMRNGAFLFVSTRPMDSNGTPSCGGADIYRLVREDGVAKAVNLGCTVNSAGSEWSPYLLQAHGKTWLYFSSDGLGGEGGQDLFMSRLGDDGFGTPVALAPLNTEHNEFRPNLRQDGLEIVFDSDRPGRIGATDVYASTRASLHARWDEAWHVDAGGVNTAAGESRASLSWDGTALYFGRAGDIYSATRSKLGGDG